MAESNVNTSGGTVVASSSDAPAPPVAGGPPPAPPPAAAVGGGTMVAVAGDPVPAPVVTQTSAPVTEDLIGETLLGRYRIIKRLGEGGMGTVYLGEHVTIQKRFAVKVLSQEFAHKADLRERFLQEARAASMISQENVVEITDFGDTPYGSVFFIMEFLDGEDLSDTVKKNGMLPWSRVKPIMLQICRALAAAHEAGIIHRDMKPENCYRTKRGKNDDFIKVIDFGIAKVATEDGEGGKGLTRTGMIFGTPEYMSPEQAQGAKPDHRVDVYALGVIMYELLTGNVPFTADTFMGILTKHMFEVPEAPSAVVPEADIPEEVEAIILKAMQKDRELRFTDMNDMAAAIESVGSGAGAVNVVAENIARPSTGEMAFTGGRQTTMPGTVPPVAGAYEEPKSKKGLWFGLIGGLILAAAGVGGFLAFGGKDKEKPNDDKQAEAEKDPAPVAEPPEVEPEIVEPPPEPEKVKELVGVKTVNLFITTRDPDGNIVVAKILDPLDNAIYGMTFAGVDAEGAADYVGVPVAKSKEALEFLIVAEGFESRTLEKYPTRDKKFDVILDPVKKATKKTKKSTKKTPTPEKIEPSPKPPPDTKKKKKTPPRLSPDLKDPFGGN